MILAIGKIVVPPDNFVVFWPNENFVKNPSAIDNLPPDSFDSIDFTFSSVDDNEEGLADKAVVHFARFTGLIKLIMDRSDLTDASLSAMGKLTNLEHLSFFMTSVDGSALKNLANLKNLKSLKFSNCSFKPSSFAYLANFPMLETLQMSRSGAHDRDLAVLLKLPHLRNLNISSNAALTDDCLDTIAKIKTLRRLEMAGTRISTSALQKLKNCPLKSLEPPMETYSDADLKRMQSWFPHVELRVSTGKDKVEKQSDEDYKTLFGPLTR